MSWSDRLREEITLISPEGTSFTALWARNNRTVEKKLGIFTYPSFRGADVQDLGIGGAVYPITIFFEGADNDIESDQFFKACAESGPWAITHPVLGEIDLQLISVSQIVDPTGSGGITQFDTEWIEPISEERIRSTQQLAADIIDQVIVVNETAASQFEKAYQDTFTETASIESTINEIIGVVQNTLSPIYQQASAVDSRVQSVIRSVQDLISQPVIDLAGVAGQIQTLIQLPVLAIADTKSRLSAYSTFFDRIFGSTDPDTGAVVSTGITPPTDDSTEGYNIAATQELAAVAGVTAMAQIAATSIATIDTRAQAIETAEIVSDRFSDITDELDVFQELFESADIPNQYFSQSESFNDAALIIAQSAAYLIAASFDLKKEKRFMISAPKAPIAITIEEYGDLGESDSNFDLFITSNGLKANDILLLPAGREVVVYV